MNRRKMKIKGQLRAYIKWPLMLSILLIAMNAGMFAIKLQAGLVMAVFTLVYIIVAAVIYFSNKEAIVDDLVNFATQYGQVLMAACVPLCFYAAKMRVYLWCVWLKNRLVVAVCRNLLVTLFACATQAAVVRMETRYGTSREQ